MCPCRIDLPLRSCFEFPVSCPRGNCVQGFCFTADPTVVVLGFCLFHTSPSHMKLPITSSLACSIFVRLDLHHLDIGMVSWIAKTLSF